MLHHSPGHGRCGGGIGSIIIQAPLTRGADETLHTQLRIEPYRALALARRSGIRRGYHTGRATIVVRARAHIEENDRGRNRIIVTEIPYQQARDRIELRIATLVSEGRIEGISATRNESDLKEPVRLILELKRDADPQIVLNQLYKFSPLQDSFSLILLALVVGGLVCSVAFRGNETISATLPGTAIFLAQALMNASLRDRSTPT